MAQATFKVNPSLQSKIKAAQDQVEDGLKEVLLEISDVIISRSPVDTGAYVTSHSFKANNTRSRGRGKSSRRKPRNQDVQQKRSEGKAQLASDISQIDLSTLERATFRNDSPHARYVEDVHVEGGVFRYVRGVYR